MFEVTLADCTQCGHPVEVEWWQNENDHGDHGYVKTCGHDDYVAQADTWQGRPVLFQL